MDAQVPDEMRASVRQALRDAYGCADATRAKRLLTNLVRRLREQPPGAAASLEEGLDETLTVMRLGLPHRLERRLSTTNAIENVIGSMRRIAARVKRWRNGQMILRWTVAAIADAATRFRRVVGGRDGMTQLMRAQRARECARARCSEEARRVGRNRRWRSTNQASIGGILVRRSSRSGRLPLSRENSIRDRRGIQPSR
ncbi:MAG TPA: transposase [Kofleriaceae bacterium]|nr:transposase [Kofleriaceae bacterium]